MNTIADTLTTADFTTCPTCTAYAARRAPVLAPAIAARILRTNETPEEVVNRFLAGVHARHTKANSAPVPAITLTDTELRICSLNQLVANPPAWNGLRAWCAEHGINDRTVVPSESIVRHPDSIEYTAYATDVHGHWIRRGGDPIKERVTHRLILEPAPWPAALLELADRTRA